ncbi:hypothetical protein [Actinophytocola sp.]|uniref:hypothetical protein n=1 Tax=Actinophytocola sp. TaxID=1872138 RepID=UPI002D75BB33|nr:hypothetical protein [Actinophytocola sp.]HYQ68501.1 hypothetical protein [Actinophytocola sp.]
MAASLTDERVTSVLRTFVRACNTVLPSRPGAAEERVRWWLDRPGRLTALAASVTGLAGAVGDLLPLQDALGAAGEGLLLCAVAQAHGVTDVDTKVRLLAAVLFDREVAPPAEPSDPAEPPARRVGVKPTARWLWRQGRLLMAMSDELEKRPKGRFYHRVLGMLPIVGMAGDYLGERAALRRTARAGTRWLTEHPASQPG